MDALRLLGESVRAQLSALIRLASEIGPRAGTRAVGSEWPAAVEAARAALAESQRRKDAPPARLHVIAAADEAEAEATVAAAAAEVILDPRAVREASIGFSHTFSENLGTLVSTALAAGRLAAGRFGAAAAWLSAEGGARSAEADLADAWERRPSPGGELATAFYCAALRARGDRRGLAGLAAEALGIPPDSPAEAEKDSAELRKYAPVQAMAYAWPRAQQLPRGDGPPTPPHGSPPRLYGPELRLSTRYELGPLIAPGDQFTEATGLNWRLVNRLRTITSEPAEGRPPPAAEAIPAIVRGGVTVAASPAAHWHLEGPQGARGEFAGWAPFAGQNPLARAREAAAGELIAAGLKADEGRAGPGLVRRYQGAELPAGSPPPARMVSAIVAEFDALLSAPGADAKPWAELVGDEKYAARAVAAVGSRMAAEAARKAPQGAPAGLARELALSAAAASGAAELQLRRALRGVRQPASADSSAVADKALRLRAVAVRAEAAAADPLTPLVLLPPSLKLFAAGHCC